MTGWWPKRTTQCCQKHCTQAHHQPESQHWWHDLRCLFVSGPPTIFLSLNVIELHLCMQHHDTITASVLNSVSESKRTTFSVLISAFPGVSLTLVFMCRLKQHTSVCHVHVYDRSSDDTMNCICSFIDHIRGRPAAPVQHPLLSVPWPHRLCQQPGSRAGPGGGQHERDRRGSGGRHGNRQTSGGVKGDASPQTRVEIVETILVCVVNELKG